MLRFFIESLILQAAAAPVTFLLWSAYFRGGFEKPRVYWVLYVATLGYILIPLGLGYLVGGRQNTLARNLGWTAFRQRFAAESVGLPLLLLAQGYVRARLKKDGHWVAGTFALDTQSGRRGYASSVADADDLYLPLQLRCDNQTGLRILDDEGSPIPIRWGLLICRTDLDVLEFQDWP